MESGTPPGLTMNNISPYISLHPVHMSPHCSANLRQSDTPPPPLAVAPFQPPKPKSTLLRGEGGPLLQYKREYQDSMEKKQPWACAAFSPGGARGGGRAGWLRLRWPGALQAA